MLQRKYFKIKIRAQFIELDLEFRHWTLFWSNCSLTEIQSGCSHLATLVLRSRIFLPWRWRRYVPPKRRLAPELHSATSQKTTFFIINVVIIFICALEDQTITSNLNMFTFIYLLKFVKFLTISKSSFFDFTKYFNLPSYEILESLRSRCLATAVV
jgi:hypothetical protein